MAPSGKHFGSMAHQYPEPSRPLQAHYTDIQPKVPEKHRFSDQYFDGFNDFEQNWTTESGEQNRAQNHDSDDLPQILRGFVHELDEKGLQKFKKLVSKADEKVPIERFFKETLHDFRARPASEVFEKFVGKLNSGEVKDRHAIRDILTAAEGEEQRVERFKVKTVNVTGVGVVKEEQN